MPRLDRPALFETLRNRRCYGTTGARLHLEIRARFAGGALRFADDPRLGPTERAPAEAATMGDILRTDGPRGDASRSRRWARRRSSASCCSTASSRSRPCAATPRPISAPASASLFEGAEDRGRGREVFWRGRVSLAGNRFTRAQAVNFFNVDRPLRTALDGRRLDFDSVTTGNFAGFDLWLEDPDAGELTFSTSIIERTVRIAEIGLEDLVFEAGGLGRRLRLFRLPEINPTWRMRFTRQVPLRPGVDNPLYVRLTQEDGHQAWSSPIYVIP